jgi:acetyl esterase/lipase
MVQIIFFLYRSVILYIGGDENTKVGVAGDSAGGLIAASVCHTIKNLDFQVIVLYLIKSLIF